MPKLLTGKAIERYVDCNISDTNKRRHQHMNEGEFDLIHRLFKGAGGSPKAFTQLGIGDDASIHQSADGLEMVVSTDSSVQNVHWPDNFPLDLAADRAVCSALSDLAAMGAEPVCSWLNVMAVDGQAVESMGQGATAALQRYDVELVGGDTCRSATNAIAVTVAGQLPKATAMRRDAAKVDDGVWLCGRLGFHSLGLKQWFDGDFEADFVPCFKCISPLLEQGMALRKLGVVCCIDISDGLLQDAEHICRASGLGIDVDVNAVPDWSLLVEKVGVFAALQAVAQGGEDYALLFTAPLDWEIPADLAVCIGRCKEGHGVRLLMAGECVDIGSNGFDHFN